MNYLKWMFFFGAYLLSSCLMAMAPVSEAEDWSIIKQYFNTPSVAALFTAKMKDAMKKDKNLAPRFMAVLGDGKSSSVDVLNNQEIDEIGEEWEQVKDQLAVFKIGHAENAEKLLLSDEKITVRFNDLESKIKGLRWNSFSVSNGRQTYYPLQDGSWIAVKGCGAFNEEDSTFYKKKGSVWMGVLKKNDLKNVKRMINNQSFEGASDCFVIPFASKDIYYLPDSAKGWHKVPEDIEIMQTFSRAITPHRLEELPKLLALDPGLKKLSKEVSITLKNMGIIEKNKQMNPADLFIHIADKMGKSEAIKENEKIYKRTFNSQDINFGGQECDSEEALSPEEMLDYILEKRISLYGDEVKMTKEDAYEELLRINSSLWILFKEEKIWVDPLIAKVQSLTLAVEHAMNVGEDKGLFPDPAKIFERMFVSYFENLNVYEQEKWDRLLVPGGMLEDALKKEIALIFQGDNLFKKGTASSGRMIELGVSEDQIFGTIFHCFQKMKQNQLLKHSPTQIAA